MAYTELKSDQERIEDEIGVALNWVEPKETPAGKFRSKIQIGKDIKLEDRDSWDEYTAWMLDFGERFHDAFYGRIQRLDHL